jgi:HEAT repeat protein
MKRGVVVVAAALFACAAATVAHGDELATLKQKIASADENEAEDAARRLGELGDGKSLDVLLDALALGPGPKVQAAILGALAGKKDARAVGVVKHFTRNRNTLVRKRAVQAIGELGDPRAVAPLIAALSDPVEEVRAAAAAALGKRKEASAADRLVKLLEHKDAAAAPALAQIAGPPLVHRLSEMLGQVPDDLLCTTLAEILKRPDFGPDPVRLEIVKTLSKVPGVDSTTALVEYLAASEKDKTRPSRLEAEKIVAERSSN